MKLTWLGGTAVRLHVGGQILVANAETAAPHLDQHETIAGADRLFRIGGDDLPPFDPTRWRPRQRTRMIDDAHDAGAPTVYRVDPHAVLIEAPDEPATILTTGDTKFGRWADGAVVGVFGDAAILIDVVKAALAQSRPKLVVLAGRDAEVDQAMEALHGTIDGVGLIVLESGMALEV